MSNYIIEVSTDEEVGIVNKGIVEFNSTIVPFTQDPPFIPINRVIKDSSGNVIAGINSLMYCWKCVYVDVLWVVEEYRDRGLGTQLLTEVENIAKSKDCHLIHLDTFDFQAKDFYLKRGYEVIGELDDDPIDHKRYYMKKCI